MKIHVYLNFNGNCREAIEFYAEAFETEMPHISTFGEGPKDPNYQMPEEAKNLVMNAQMNINGSRVMFSDTFPGAPFTQGNNISIAIVSNNEDELKTYFNNLKAGGKVDMELGETFWSKCFGMVTDKFDIHWLLSHEE